MGVRVEKVGPTPTPAQEDGDVEVKVEGGASPVGLEEKVDVIAGLVNDFCSPLIPRRRYGKE